MCDLDECKGGFPQQVIGMDSMSERRGHSIKIMRTQCQDDVDTASR